MSVEPLPAPLLPARAPSRDPSRAPTRAVLPIPRSAEGGGLREDPEAGRTAGLVALALVQVCFGLFPVFGRVAMDGFSPFAVATWRILAGALVLLGLALVVHRGSAVPERRSDWVALAAFAFLGIVLNQGLFLVGLERSTPMNAGLVICLIPVFAYGVAVLSGRETLARTRVLGVVVAFVGALPLFFSRGGDLAGRYALGNALMAANALCYAVYLVFSKPLLKRLPPLALVAWIYVLSLPWVPFFAWNQDLVPEAATRSAWLSLAYVLVFPTIVAYALNSFALARVQASTTAFFIFAQPIITALAAWAVLDERPTAALGLAGLLLFAGMALVLHRPRPPETAP